MLSRLSSFSGPLAKLFGKTNDVYSFVTQNLILYLDAGLTASYPGTGTSHILNNYGQYWYYNINNRY